VSGQGRTFAGAANSSDNMTNELCQTYCNNLGFPYSGTEFKSECYCGRNAPTVRSNACTMTCAAAGSTDICGGPNALTIRYNSAIAAALAQYNAVAAGYTSQGCYSDHYPVRVLSGPSSTAASMTVESCLNFCSSTGYNIAGLENGSECYCGNAVSSDGSTYGVGGQAGCTFACGGNSTQLCGGNNVLNLYSKGGVVVTTTSAAPTTTSSTTPPFTPLPTAAAGYTFLGCYLDSTNRTLTKQLSDVSSVEACISGCSSSGYRYAGLEYYSQCFCDNQIVNNGPTIINAQNCNYACNGSPSQTCGGSNALQIYSGTPAAPATSIPSGFQGYTYMDTFADGPSARVLSVPMSMSSTTVEACIASCASAGYSFAGLEYGAECYCGSAMLNNPAGGKTPTMSCQGKASEYCGGPNAIQIYSGTLPPPQYLQTPFNNGQCATDNVNSTRTLGGASFSGSNMTPQLCRTSCQGFTYFGVEYGGECYCGNTFPSRTPISSACTMACAGDSTQICGGSNALNMYNA